jgi:predicted secreted protein
VRNYRVGLPDYRRKGVRRYRIHQVVISPRGGAMVVVVEKEQLDSGGDDIRYMVETLRLGS